MHLSSIVQVATATGATVTAISAVYGTLRIIPFFKSQVELIRENAKLRLERDEARDTAKAFQASSDGWQAAVEQLGYELKDVKEQLGEQSNQIRELSDTLGAAIMYIVECSEADRHGKPLPPPPAAWAISCRDSASSAREAAAKQRRPQLDG